MNVHTATKIQFGQLLICALLLKAKVQVQKSNWSN